MGASTKPPQIVIIRGPVGSGKTSVVEAIRSQMDDVSIVDFDSFKRQIDNSKSSSWRRELALEMAIILTKRLMESSRFIVADIHSSVPSQMKAFQGIADQMGYKLTSFLILPPLEVCFKRAEQRIVPDITYEIDRTMVECYWNQTYKIVGELEFTDPNSTPEHIARSIVATL